MASTAGKRLLFINPSWEQERLILLAHKLGYQLFALNVFSNAAYRSELFQAQASVHVRDFAAAVTVAKRFAIDHVISDQCDYSLLLQAIIAEQLNLPTVGMQQAQLSNNKYLARQRVNENPAFLQPQFSLCLDFASATRAIERIGLPVIVKPVDNRGSIGVSLVEEKQQLAAAVQAAILNSFTGLFLIEQFITGTLYISEALAGKCQIVGQKTMSSRFRYMNEEILFSLPSEDERLLQVANTHNKLCQFLGMCAGLSSAEFIIDQQQRIWLIESTNRAGGVWIGSKILMALTALDSAAHLLNTYAAATLDVATARKSRRYCLLKYLNFPPGQLLRINGQQHWQQHEAYVGHFIWQKIPGLVELPQNALLRGGVLLSSSSSKEETVRASNDMLAALEVVYE